MLQIPELVIGTAARHGAVTVLPLFPVVSRPGVAYRLGAHALASGALEIQELRGGAAVDRIEARNRGAERVLLVEGDHLLGSKQDRVLTSSALLGGQRDATLPVSCVEQGRWQEAPRRFRGAGSVAPASVRRIIKQSVTDALLDAHGRSADQSQIWSQIADQQRRLRVTSATRALEASYATFAGELRPIAASLPYAPSATGLAIGIGGHLVTIDLFDKPETCEFYWRQLALGAALEALGLSAAGSVGSHEVQALVAQLRGAAWRPVAPVGEGEELRVRTEEAAASALLVDGGLVHLGAATAARLESVARPMRRDLPPELAERYRITARLGVGGVKEVFRAADLRGGPDVAIARLPYVRPELVAHEVEISRRVQSPYVPRIFEGFIDAFEDGYIVMELCEGPNLAALASRPLTPAEAGPILVELARALRTIHAACVLHRDVKPENVLLCPTERGVQLKLIDFGLSAAAADQTSAIIELRGFGGTLPYMAREVLRGQDVDARSDVFAFGVCCYRLLVGEVPLPPTRGESEHDYILRLSDGHRHVLPRLPRLPAPAAEMIERIFASERERRPFMPEVVAAFERAFGTGPIVLPARAVPPPVPGAPSATAPSATAPATIAPAATATSTIAPAAAASSAAPIRSTPRLRLERVRHLPVPVDEPEHVLVAPCDRAPLVALAPQDHVTTVRALDDRGEVRWSQRIKARLVAGLRADLDRDGLPEIYLAGPDRVVAMTRDGKVRYKRTPQVQAPRPALAAVPDPEGSALLVNGQAHAPRTGLPAATAIRAYEGDGRRLVEALDPAGASYHGAARQAFRGARGTPAAIVAHPGEEGFLVAHLEEDERVPGLQVVIYGPGGGRVHALRVQEPDVPTLDLCETSRLLTVHDRIYGPEHAPLAVLGPQGTAVLIVPLVATNPLLESSVTAYSLPDGRELWRWRDSARKGRAMLGDLDGDGRPELVVGTGFGAFVLDPWTGAVRMEIPGPGLPVAIGDPFGSGHAHLILASEQGIELWRGQRCRRHAMSWSGLRGDLWRSGTVDACGAPIGPQ